MKLAISNIAWSAAEDITIAPALIAAGAEAIEVAPGRLFANPGLAGSNDAAKVGAAWTAAGLPIVAMQALLFGRADLKLFGGPNESTEFVAYLSRMIALAAALGCGPLVFGAPGNRSRGDLSLAEAKRRAVPMFRALGDVAAAAECVLCLEPNATDYGCDFVTTLSEAVEIVCATDHPAVGLMADTGNMQLMGETPEALLAVVSHIRHLHLSEPLLAPVGPESAFLREVVAIMRSAGYSGIVTVEMRRVKGHTAVVAEAAERALAAVRGFMTEYASSS